MKVFENLDSEPSNFGDKSMNDPRPYKTLDEAK